MRSASEAGACVELVLRVNGVERALRVPPMRRLLDVLREELGLTGTKEGCGEGECGACTVLVDGAATLACLVPACQVAGSDVLTVEGPGLDAIRSAFLDGGGAQCGICTPGMITSTRAWIDSIARDGRAPTLEDARTALAGNLCRCTGYGSILASALSAARACAEPAVRAELPSDADDVRTVVSSAFGRADEAVLVDRLRASGVEHVALVAAREERLVGHVLFTPVAIDGADVRAFGLAPLAVHPEAQRSGIGARLVRAGLDALRARGAELVVVLGEPAYYARFGFASASRMGLACEFEAPDEAFMALWLGPGRPVRGVVRYHDAFRSFA